MQVEASELIAFSITPAYEPSWPSCSECEQIAWRIVGTVDHGLKKETPLCERHFVDACIGFPVLQYLERDITFDSFQISFEPSCLPPFDASCHCPAETARHGAAQGNGAHS